jgi:hypothetical protein
VKHPKCQCGAPFEDSIHYLMECPLCENESDCLFRNLWETHKHIETLLFGNDEIKINENSMICNIVRAYIVCLVFWTFTIIVFSLIILYLIHDIFGLFLIFRSKLFLNETVGGMKDVIDILSLLLGAGLTQFGSRYSLYYETGWEPLSCRRTYRRLTTFYKMHSKLCPQYSLTSYSI